MTQSTGKKKRLLVTGGLGFIGSSLIRRLHDEYETVVLDWNKSCERLEQFEQWGSEVILEDISSPHAWDRVPPCDFVVHTAAQISAEVSKMAPTADFQTNALGTLRVAEYARKHRAAVVYCNSIRVYNPKEASAAVQRGPNYAVTEDCPLISQTELWEPPFAVSKLIGEQYLRYYANQFKVPVVSLRMSGVVGPGQTGHEKHAWLAYLVECAVNHRPYRVFGDGKQSRDILHIEDYVDLVRLLMKNLERFTANGFSVYNVGGGSKNRITLNQVIELLQTKHGLSWQLDYAEGRQGEPRDYVSSVEKISAMGWRPRRIGPDIIVAELVNWFEEGVRNAEQK
jgi:CDP-paratose 2-epimerase